MATQVRGRPRFYTILMDDFEPINADRLGKGPEPCTLKMWVKDSARVARTRRREGVERDRVLVRATLAVALGASSRDIHSKLIHTLSERLWDWPPSGSSAT
jgi:hypothetical protein